MTAIICSVSKDSATIFTDGACYDRDGTFCLPHQKTDILLHQPAIIASRGGGHAGSQLKAFSSLKPTFDELCDGMADLLLYSSGKACEDFGDPINLSVVYAGWSDREGVFLGFQMFLRGDSVTDPVEGSLEAYPIQPIYIEPWPDVELLTRRGVIGDDKILSLNSEEQVLAFMHCQREQSFQFGPRSGDAEGCIVGAFIQKTTVTRDRAFTEIVHRWNDEIGLPLQVSTG